VSHIERRLKDKEEMKQSILDAARDIGAKEGWHAVTMRKIANKLNTRLRLYMNILKVRKLYLKNWFISVSHDAQGYRESEKKRKWSEKLLTNISLVYWDFAHKNMDLFQWCLVSNAYSEWRDDEHFQSLRKYFFGTCEEQ